MGKCCIAVGCKRRYEKRSGVKFYRFPRDEAQRNAWAAAVKRKDWKPNNSSWICNEHFLGGNNPLSPAYVPMVFEHKSGALKAADSANSLY